MIKLCFGTFMTVLVNCAAPTVSNKKLCSTLLNVINPNVDISNEDAIISKLILGYSNISDDIIEKFPTDDMTELKDSFSKRVFPLLDPNKKENIIAAILNILADDEAIKDDTEIEMINKYTKRALMCMKQYKFDDFFTGVLAYIVFYTKNAQTNEYVKNITKDYIYRASKNYEGISLLKKDKAKSEIGAVEHSYHFSVDEKSLRIAILLGEWCETYSGDIDIVETIWGQNSMIFIEDIRRTKGKWPDLFRYENRQWKISDHKSRITEIAGMLYDDDIDKIFESAKKVYSIYDNKYDLPADKRHLAPILNRDILVAYSRNLRRGLGDTIAIICNAPEIFTNCSEYKIINSIYIFERELFENKGWKTFASYSDIYTVLAESCPDVFLEQIELLVEKNNIEFYEFLAESETFVVKEKYGSQLIETIRMLARKQEYFSRSMRILFMLSIHDDRFLSTLVHVILPWYPQTEANVNMRIGIIKGFEKINPCQTWRVLMKLMPNVTTTSTSPVEPKYMTIQPVTDNISGKDYFQTTVAYIELACNMIEAQVNRILDLFDILDDVDDKLRNCILRALYKNVQLLNTEDREKVWNKEQDFVMRHRKFSQSSWALSEEKLQNVIREFSDLWEHEEDFQFVRLFRTEQYKLLENVGDFERSEELLCAKQTQIVQKLYDTSGSTAVILKADSVDNKLLYGAITANILTANEIVQAIRTGNIHLESDFATGIIRNISKDMIQKLLYAFEEDKRACILSKLCICQEYFDIVETMNLENHVYYYRFINIWDIQLLSQKSFQKLIDGLIFVERNEECVSLIYETVILHKQKMTSEFVAQVLLDNINDENILKTDIYSLQQLIKWLQEHECPTDKLAKIEWKFLNLIDDSDDLYPITLLHEINSSPQLFVELIKNICGKKNPDYSEEDNLKICQQCYRLLLKWKTLPGIKRDDTFDSDAFKEWYSEVKRIAAHEKVEPVALEYIGKAIFHAPQEVDFFIVRPLADLLELESVEQLRRGYELEAINSHGVHCVDPTGETEFLIEQEYKGKSMQADTQGYIRIAAVFRSIAHYFHGEGIRSINQSKLLERNK